MIIDIIAGARPNFMKIAPIIEAIENAKSNGHNINYRLVHTGQHYDSKMSGDFFTQLGIPEPHLNLGAGGGSQAEQTSAIMIGYEKAIMDQRPDLVVVVGDVTSTMACSVTAKKMNNITVAHVEGGIRSRDLTMPEEINRLVTDAITDLFFTTSESANQNLKNEGVPKDKIHFVGNTMIDTLLKQMTNFRKPDFFDKLELKVGVYIVMTLHRPANVDAGEQLSKLIQTIVESSNGIPLIFPVHPRTAAMIEKTGISYPNLHMVEPMGYLEFNYLVQNSKAVITDSGGITEETTVMGIPCMTLRDNTERPETITVGTNELLGTNPDAIPPAMEKLFSGHWKKGSIPEMWDGKTAGRIVEVLLTLK
ncbi:MAG: UDP-N-acetylglucosamine 2-epimerase (non-hydrolyzing) [Saprospiraceae bacterium]|nr:UDP-N-acetylglucosamine 2-epimerase (non-hydrolyzing) [Candidatus Brachybacter algidus]MBK8748458.1 UDP-N-acetylglucosamine 2-epimerase (non-hydrolyzing) [Candidatus Brachybacter algidus]